MLGRRWAVAGCVCATSALLTVTMATDVHDVDFAGNFFCRWRSLSLSLSLCVRVSLPLSLCLDRLDIHSCHSFVVRQISVWRKGQTRTWYWKQVSVRRFCLSVRPRKDWESTDRNWCYREIIRFCWHLTLQLFSYFLDNKTAYDLTTDHICCSFVWQGRIHRREGTGGTCPPPQTHGNFFKSEGEFLCSLIQHTEYCYCCASFHHHSLPVCITIHLYPFLGVEHGARFVAFSGQSRFRRLLKAYMYLSDWGCGV